MVFYRAYPLYYLEQRGVPIFPQPEPAWAQYEAYMAQTQNREVFPEVRAPVGSGQQTVSCLKMKQPIWPYAL